MYGRKSLSICVHPSIPSSTKCQEQETQINAQIRGLCEGEHTCEVAANNDLLAKAGTTICPNVYKYLDIKFRSVCVRAVSFKILHIRCWVLTTFSYGATQHLPGKTGSFFQPSSRLPRDHVTVVVTVPHDSEYRLAPGNILLKRAIHEWLPSTPNREFSATENYDGIMIICRHM